MTERDHAPSDPTSVDDSTVRLEGDDVASFDPLDEEIASYLDDELNEEERRNFERRLESDPELRERFETHRSAWNALDALVEVESNVDVAESTVERLNAETRSEIVELNARKRRRERLFLFGSAFASCLFVAIGYFLFGLFFPDVQKQRYKDRFVVSRLPQLEAVGDFEYLVALSQGDFFAKPSPRNAFSSKDATNQIRSQENQEQEQSYEKLSQNRSFYRLQQRFERLDETSKGRWRLLWKKIDGASNRETLLKTLDDYSEWLTNVANDEERERLRTGNVSERIAEIRRKNEELARFWERFSLRSQFTDGKSNKQREKEKNEYSSSNDSTPSPPFATSMLTLRNLLPEELRREDFRSVYQKYEFFRQNNDYSEKDADDVLNFLKSDSNVYDSLSQDAKKYLASLSEDERLSALSLITALCVSEKNASDYYRRNVFHRQSAPTPSNDAFRMEGAFSSYGSYAGRQNVSIRELASDLRNADSNVRDYVTSRPAPEAQALLFGLHWGGGRMKFGSPSRASDSTPSFSNDPFNRSSSQQERPQRFDFHSPDKKLSPNMR